MSKCGCEFTGKFQNFVLHSGAKLEENCVEAQKKELAENLEQEDCQANEGDEEETVLLGAVNKRFLFRAGRRGTQVLSILWM